MNRSIQFLCVFISTYHCVTSGGSSSAEVEASELKKPELEKSQVEKIVINFAAVPIKKSKNFVGNPFRSENQDDISLQNEKHEDLASRHGDVLLHENKGLMPLRNETPSLSMQVEMQGIIPPQLVNPFTNGVPLLLENQAGVPLGNENEESSMVLHHDKQDEIPQQTPLQVGSPELTPIQIEQPVVVPALEPVIPLQVDKQEIFPIKGEKSEVVPVQGGSEKVAPQQVIPFQDEPLKIVPILNENLKTVPLEDGYEDIVPQQVIPLQDEKQAIIPIQDENAEFGPVQGEHQVVAPQQLFPLQDEKPKLVPLKDEKQLSIPQQVMPVQDIKQGAILPHSERQGDMPSQAQQEKFNKLPIQSENQEFMTIRDAPVQVIPAQRENKGGPSDGNEEKEIIREFTEKPRITTIHYSTKKTTKSTQVYKWNSSYTSPEEPNGAFYGFAKGMCDVLLTRFSDSQLKSYLPILARGINKLGSGFYMKWTIRRWAKKLRKMAKRKPSDTRKRLTIFCGLIVHGEKHMRELMRSANNIFTYSKETMLDDYVFDLKQYAKGHERRKIKKKTKTIFKKIIFGSFYKQTELAQGILIYRFKVAMLEYLDLLNHLAKKDPNTLINEEDFNKFFDMDYNIDKLP